MDAATALARLAEVIDAHDWVGLSDLLHPDFTCRFVHTGEAFDKQQWVRLNADYPGFERMLVEDLVTVGDRGVLRATVIGRTVAGDEQRFALASFATVRDGLLLELTEVWADIDQAPPDNKRPD